MSSKKKFLNTTFLFFQNLSRFVAYIKILFVRNQCISSSAALSYTSLLALVPLLSLSFAILSSFSSLKDIQQYVLTYFFSHLLLDSSHVFIDNLNIFISTTQHLDTLGTILLIASIMFVFTKIEKTFNIIWSVKYPRSFLQRILSFWALITLGPIVAGVGINIFLSAISEFSKYSFLKGSFSQGLTSFLPFFSLFIIFTLIYLIIPNHKVRFLHALFGAFIAAFTMEVFRHLFLSYITYLPSYQFIYKTLSTLPLFIVWMYIFWSLVLFGAQVVASLPDWGNLPAIRFLFLLSTENIFLNTLKIIEVIHKNQKKGISSQAILNEIKISGEEFEKIINKLHKARIIGESQEGLIFLIQEEGQEITLYQVYKSQGFGVHEIHELDKNRPWTSSWVSQAITLLNKLQNAEQTTLNISIESFLGSSSPSNKPS